MRKIFIDTLWRSNIVSFWGKENMYRNKRRKNRDM